MVILHPGVRLLLTFGTSLLTLRKMATTFGFNLLFNTCLKNLLQSMLTVKVVTRGF